VIADILHQDQADEEHRGRDARDRNGDHQPVEQAPAMDGRQRAQRDPQRHRPNQAGEHQLGGGADRLQQFGGDAGVGDQRDTEIALQHAREIDAELHEDGPVEPQILPDLGDELGRRGGAGDDRRRIGRDELQQQEAEEQNAQKDGYG